ncbi:hypothetical protein [Rubritalea tangerina]
MLLRCSAGGLGEHILEIISESNVEWVAALFIYLKSRNKRYKYTKDGAVLEANNVKPEEFAKMMNKVNSIYITGEDCEDDTE